MDNNLFPSREVYDKMQTFGWASSPPTASEIASRFSKRHEVKIFAFGDDHFQITARKIPNGARSIMPYSEGNLVTALAKIWIFLKEHKQL